MPCSGERTLPDHLRKDADGMVESMLWDDQGPALAGQMGSDPAGAPSDLDDEYRRAGMQDPSICLTTSHNPSSRLKMFAKVRSSCGVNGQHWQKLLNWYFENLHICRTESIFMKYWPKCNIANFINFVTLNLQMLVNCTLFSKKLFLQKYFILLYFKI